MQRDLGIQDEVHAGHAAQRGTGFRPGNENRLGQHNRITDKLVAETQPGSQLPVLSVEGHRQEAVFHDLPRHIHSIAAPGTG